MKNIKEEILKELDKLTDNYKKYAGEWHNDNCDFPEVDQAVCHCNLILNQKSVESFLSSAINEVEKEVREEILSKLPEEKEMREELEEEEKLAIERVEFRIRNLKK